MEYTTEQIALNYELLINEIKGCTNGEKQKKTLELYEKLEDRIATAPASGTTGYHGSFVMGYLRHVLKVVDCAKANYELWTNMGANMSGYTLNELIFAAINHDLGKIGSLEQEYYLPNPSDWHVKNQGKIYISNPKLENMTVPDRSLFLLQQAGVELSTNEWIAIKTHDGAYVDENKPYWISWDPNKKFKNNMPIVLHYADYMAYRIETEEESSETIITPKSIPVKTNNNAKNVSTSTQNANALFDAMFATDNK